MFWNSREVNPLEHSIILNVKYIFFILKPIFCRKSAIPPASSFNVKKRFPASRLCGQFFITMLQSFNPKPCTCTFVLCIYTFSLEFSNKIIIIIMFIYYSLIHFEVFTIYPLLVTRPFLSNQRRKLSVGEILTTITQVYSVAWKMIYL